MIKQKTHISAIAVAAVLFTGCASMPNSKLKYYLPKADVQLGAVMTMACVKDKDTASFQLKYIVSPTISSEISSDYEAAQTIDLHKFNNRFGSNDIAVSWYEDGRLKGINSSSTGGGSEVLEAALTLVDTAAGGVGIRASGEQEEKADTANNICRKMAAAKIATLSFQYQYPERLSSKTVAEDFILMDKKPCKKDNCTVKLKLSTGSAALRKTYGLGDKRIPNFFEADFHRMSYSFSDRITSSRNGQGIPIVLRDTQLLSLSILPQNIPQGSIFKKRARKVIPGQGSASAVYIPNTPLFGSNQFSLTLTQNGSVSSIKYGATSGSAQAIGSLNSLVTALSGPTDAELAAKYKVKGDAIENHDRLLCLEGVAEAC